MSKRYYLISLVLSFFAAPSNAAYFRIESVDGGCLGNTFNLIGEIKRGDAAYFSNLVAQQKKKFTELDCKGKHKLPDHEFNAAISLQSSGGDVNEAMKIGHIVRANEFTAMVANNKDCFSSCVFILGAGVLRYSFGKVGIHKPYFSELKENITTAEIKKLRDENIKSIKEYFNFMDVSESIVEDMLSIEPSKIKILSDDEMDKYRLSIPDSNYDEKVTAKDAREYNLTSGEYRRKKVIADSKCGTIASTSDFQFLFKCQHIIYLDISAKEYDSRRTKAFSNCSQEKEPKKRRECFHKYTVLNK